MAEAFICDAVRTPIGRYAGSLSSVRVDDLAALPLKALMGRNPKVDWNAVDDVVLGCVNQSGEDSRNVARMALLLAGLPERTPGATVYRLCGSGLEALGHLARAIKTGEAEFGIAGGVEGMSRAPFVMGKPTVAFSRAPEIYDSTMGWRFPNKALTGKFGADSMPETAENVAEEFQISRADQDAFALRSQQRANRAIASGRFKEEIVPVEVSGPKGIMSTVERDEHPRETTLEALVADDTL